MNTLRRLFDMRSKFTKIPQTLNERIDEANVDALICAEHERLKIAIREGKAETVEGSIKGQPFGLSYAVTFEDSRYLVVELAEMIVAIDPQ